MQRPTVSFSSTGSAAREAKCFVDRPVVAAADNFNVESRPRKYKQRAPKRASDPRPDPGVSYARAQFGSAPVHWRPVAARGAEDSVTALEAADEIVDVGDEECRPADDGAPVRRRHRRRSSVKKPHRRDIAIERQEQEDAAELLQPSECRRRSYAARAEHVVMRTPRPLLARPPTRRQLRYRAWAMRCGIPLPPPPAPFNAGGRMVAVSSLARTVGSDRAAFRRHGVECRHYATPAGCRNGVACQFLHYRPDLPDYREPSGNARRNERRRFRARRTVWTEPGSVAAVNALQGESGGGRYHPLAARMHDHRDDYADTVSAPVPTDGYKDDRGDEATRMPRERNRRLAAVERPPDGEPPRGVAHRHEPSRRVAVSGLPRHATEDGLLARFGATRGGALRSVAINRDDYFGCCDGSAVAYVASDGLAGLADEFALLGWRLHV